MSKMMARLNWRSKKKEHESVQRYKAYEFLRDLKNISGVPRIYHYDYTTTFTDAEQRPVLTDIIGQQLVVVEFDKHTKNFNGENLLQYLQGRVSHYNADAFSLIFHDDVSTFGALYHRYPPKITPLSAGNCPEHGNAKGSFFIA